MLEKAGAMDHQTARQRFAPRLRTLRAEKGITQEQLAESISKAAEHISFLEQGERAPSFEVAVDLARVLDLSVSYLVCPPPLQAQRGQERAAHFAGPAQARPRWSA